MKGGRERERREWSEDEDDQKGQWEGKWRGVEGFLILIPNRGEKLGLVKVFSYSELGGFYLTFWAGGLVRVLRVKSQGLLYVKRRHI